MATLTTMSSPMRQPFASLDSPRLRNLTNTRNRQNALPTVFSSSVKRRYAPPTIFDDVDSENIEPSSVSSPTKRSKIADSAPIKKSQFILTDAQSTSLSPTKPSISRPSTLRLDTPLAQKGKTATPSTTSAAGRSPKSKKIGILSRRRASASPFTRVDPPTYDQPGGLPFSIDAALSGSIPTYTARSEPKPVQKIQARTIEESVPKGWVFHIHEDTIEDEMANIMEHSTCTLDISDDEGSRAAKDDRGKENIPPLDHTTSVPTAAVNQSDNNIAAPAVAGSQTKARCSTAKMVDEDRSPLGHLDAADFYAEGLTADSVILVPVGPSEKLAASNDAKNFVCATSARSMSNDPTMQKYEQKAVAGKLEGGLISKDAVEKIKIWDSGSDVETEGQKEIDGETISTKDDVPITSLPAGGKSVEVVDKAKSVEDVVMA